MTLISTTWQQVSQMCNSLQQRCKIKLHSFGSSSAGNSYLVQLPDISFGIDMGVGSFTNPKNYLQWQKVRYLFISHEHSDHVGNLLPFLKLFPKVKVVINPACLVELMAKRPQISQYQHRFITLDYNQQMTVANGRLKGFALKINHNSAANNGYIFIIDNKFKLVFFTDCGSFNYDLYPAKIFANTNIFMIESNHIDGHFTSTKFLSKEQLQHSSQGHFSQKQSLEFIDYVRDQNNQDAKWFLLHRSLTNYPDLAADNVYVELGLKFMRLPEHRKSFKC